MDTTPPPDIPAPPTPAPPAGRPALRTAAYCLLLGVLAAVLMFWELGGDALTGDEAQYALVVQNIKRSGDWVYVSPYPPTPYLQKPPLYFWLTALTYDLFGGPGEFAYRAWSAAAGVGAVVLTCVLGALLFGPEVGGLAGLLLLTNRAFLLVHGARSGTFDALVTFLIAAGAVLYVLMLRGRLRWTGWVGIGVAAALASLAKPMVGVPLLVLLAAHAAMFGRRTVHVRRAAGPLVLVVAFVLIAAPWYVAQWREYPDFRKEMVDRNLRDRVLEGVDDKHVEDWKFYLEQVSKSSPPFLLVIPAAAYAVFAWARGPGRSEHALLVVLGAGWVLLFSFSVSKAVHYVYPAFPFLAVILAAAAARVGSAAAAAGGVAGAARHRLAFAAGAVLQAAFVFQYARTLYVAIPADRSPYVPWEMYKALAPAVRAGEARVAFFGFPDLQVHWRDRMRLRARDCYYLEQMRPGATWLSEDVGALGTFLHDRKPTLLILSRLTDVGGLLDNSNLPQRIDDRFSYAHHAFLMGGVDLDPLLQPRAKPGSPSPYLSVEPTGEPGTFRLTVTPSMPASARLGARLRLPAGTAAEPVRYAFALQTADGKSKTLEDSTARPVGDILAVSAMVEDERWQGLAPHTVVLTLRSTSTGAPLLPAVTVEEVRLTMAPHIPPEPHPRR
jgi:4-amino-4-deoxy-L-arabinose transferase-like glycosyltransferase